jgi:hypothetical protein
MMALGGLSRKVASICTLGLAKGVGFEPVINIIGIGVHLVIGFKTYRGGR